MTKQIFSLIPFPDASLPAVTLTGEISRQGHLLTVRYFLLGKVADVLFPARAIQPGRKDELWKMTCFEFFLAIKDQPQYWEFNLSPSGDWNVYHMEAYRRVGFREETAMQQLPFEMKTDASRFTLEAVVDLRPILREDQEVEAGITGVLQTRDGNETYWALAHPAPQPDFHLRQSFVLVLASQAHSSPQSSFSK